MGRAPKQMTARWEGPWGVSIQNGRVAEAENRHRGVESGEWPGRGERLAMQDERRSLGPPRLRSALSKLTLGMKERGASGG